MGFIALSVQLDLFRVNEFMSDQSSLEDTGFVTNGESRMKLLLSAEIRQIPGGVLAFQT